MIVVCKNNGVIQLEESLKNTNRIGIYYQYLINKIEGKSNIDILNSILTCLGLKKGNLFGRGMYVISQESLGSIYKYCKNSSENIKKNFKSI